MRIAILFFAMLTLLGCSKPSWHMTDISGAMPRLDFHMTADGKPVTAEDFKGKVAALYFGYSHCPDVCPATLANLTGMMAKVGSPDVRVLFVTVDPDRDTDAVLRDQRLLRDAFERVDLRGDVLELAAGTGTWTERIVDLFARAGISVGVETIGHRFCLVSGARS